MLLWGPLDVLADEEPFPQHDRRAKMEVLLEELRSPDFSQRTAAEKGIEQLGPVILEELPSLSELATPSEKAALQRIRDALEREAIRLRLQPTMVDIQPGVELSALLESWRQKTGNDFLPPVSQGASLVVSAPPERLPYWLAIQELSRRQGLRTEYDDQARRWRFRSASKLNTPPWRVTTDGAVQGRLRFREVQPVGERQQLLKYEFELAYEPRLRPLFATFSMADVKFRTSSDQQVSAWNPGAQYELLATPSGAPLVGRLEVLTSVGVQPDSVAMTLPVTVNLSVGSQRLAISQSELAPGARVSQGPVRLRIDRVEWPNEKNDRRLAIEIRVIWEVRGPPFESHRTWVYHNAAYWEESEESRTAPVQMELLQQSSEGVRLRYEFSEKVLETGSGRFVYEAPTLVTPQERTLHWGSVKDRATDE